MYRKYSYLGSGIGWGKILPKTTKRQEHKVSDTITKARRLHFAPAGAAKYARSWYTLAYIPVSQKTPEVCARLLGCCDWPEITAAS